MTGTDETARGEGTLNGAKRRDTNGAASGAAAIGKNVFARLAVVLVLLAMIVIFSLLKPDTFATVDNAKSILVTQAPLIVLALGLTIALAAGEFDLSIAAVVGFTASLISVLTVNHGWSTGAAVLVSLAAAIAVGSVNAILVVKADVNSFITTLGVGTFVTGLALAVSGSTTIGGIPSSLTDPVQNNLFGVGLPVFYALVLAIALWYVLDHTPVGRYLFFTGASRNSARLAGVRVDSIRIGALLLSAVFAWAAGVLLLGQTGASDSGFGQPMLLPAFAAGFLGATTIKPGRFNIWGTVIAVLLLATGSTGLQLLGAADYVESLFTGGALVLAITLARVTARTSA